VFDESRRSSTFRALTDATLFSKCDSLVEHISAADPNYKYVLVQNDVTQIKYVQNDHFGVHQDYLSVTSNCVEEFTLLVALNSPEAAEQTTGGHTRVYFEAGGKGKAGCLTCAYDTTKPGTALLFRKDLDHEGEPVISGSKEILSLNIHAFRKRTTTQVLLVEFDDECSEPPKKSSRAESLLAIANAKTYAICVDDVPQGSMLYTHIEWANRETSLPIVRYKSVEFDFSSFATVYRVIMRMHVDAKDIERDALALAFFGPFNR
jgi:hypothetical protein